MRKRHVTHDGDKDSKPLTDRRDDINELEGEDSKPLTDRRDDINELEGEEDAWQVAVERARTYSAPWRTSIIHSMLIVAFCLRAFRELFSNSKEFTNYDDQDNFVRGKAVHLDSITVANIHWAISDGTIHHVYEPVALLFKMATFAAFGKSAQAVACCTLVIHICNVVLFHSWASKWVIVFSHRQLTAVEQLWIHWAMLLGVLFFSIHPLRAEAVAWCSCQPFVLASFWAINSVHWHLHSRLHGTFGAYLLSLLAIVCAILSKAAAASLPAAIIVLDFYLHMMLQRNHYKAVLYSCFSRGNVLCLLCSLLSLKLAATATAATADSGLSLLQRVLRACYMVGIYPFQTLLPYNLTVLRDCGPEDIAFSGAFVLSVLIVAVLNSAMLIELVLWRSNRWSRIAVLFGTYEVLLLPTLGLVSHHISTLSQDRYSYIPQLFTLPLLVAACVFPLFRRWSTSISKMSMLVLVAFAGALCSCGYSTSYYCRVWSTTESLFHDAARINPAHESVFINLGNFLKVHGRTDEAIDIYSQGWKATNATVFLVSRGSILYEDGRMQEAEQLIKLAIDVIDNGGKHANKDLSLASYLYGRILADRGDFNTAEKYLASAARYELARGQAVATYFPNPDVVLSYGAILSRSAKWMEALNAYRTAVALNPRDETMHFNIGNALKNQKKMPEAGHAFEHALSLNPSHIQSLTNYGNTLLSANKNPRALAMLKQASKIVPTSVPVIQSLAVALLRNHQPSEALALLKGASSLQPDSRALAGLLQQLAKQGLQ